MVGGGIRRDDGAMGIGSTNVFAALESLKKKKKSSDTDRKGLSKRKGSSMAQGREPEPPQVSWVPTPLNKSWADVDDDDDDDDGYFKSAPVLPGWGSTQTQDNRVVMAHSVEEDSESEDDGLIEGDYEEEEEPEQDPEASVPDEPISKNSSPAPVALKDPERQLSKKELKKKELALLAEFKVSNKEEKSSVPVENYVVANEEGKENASTQENIKTSKKKKVKKEKSSKEDKDAQKSTNDPNASDRAVGAELKEVSVSSEVDIKEKLKKIASKKKKSTTKDTDAPSKAAAIEAAARSAKLATVKKKEKSHYNQQPVR